MLNRRSHQKPVDSGALDFARLQLAADIAAACADLQEQARKADLARLKEPVRRFSRAARTSGTPVERMLVLLKECIGESTLHQLDHGTYGDAREWLVHWAIDEFYQDDGTAKRTKQ